MHTESLSVLRQVFHAMGTSVVLITPEAVDRAAATTASSWSNRNSPSRSSDSRGSARTASCRWEPCRGMVHRVSGPFAELVDRALALGGRHRRTLRPTVLPR